jgi:NAD(P)-dependent dehydrogenase (short-subunit alcohol dehydrogenase family)
MSIQFAADEWAVILGGSSGLGLASAKKLASHGMNVAVVHRDRKGAMARIDAELASIRACGVRLLSFNIDATAEAERERVADLLAAELLPAHGVRLLLHSIAFGNLKPAAPSTAAGAADELLLEDEDFVRTVYAMGLSQFSWTRALHSRGLFRNGARILGLTSEGGARALPGYAAVSAAKSALEAVSRSIAVEYAPHGLRCNVLQPGVTDTPALRLIPGHERMLEAARAKNPSGRLTLPTDVADVVALLCTPEAFWINGAILRVDGGEFVAG